MRIIALLFAVVALGTQFASAADLPGPHFRRESFTVDGDTRTALIYVPPAGYKDPHRPVVFVFHSHGGTSESAQRQFPVNRLWHDAVSVYMQGLKTGSPLDREATKNGWQMDEGEYNDRDLKFFDVVYKFLVEKLQVDEKHVYVTGSSNGGGFTYLLWAARGDKLTAVAPSEAPRAEFFVPRLKPKPVLNIAGEKDPLVKLDGEKRAVAALVKLNGCDESGKKAGRFSTLYSSTNGTPVISLIHQGGHEVPDFVPTTVVNFFLRNYNHEQR